jgi:hypothetical protein
MYLTDTNSDDDRNEGEKRMQCIMQEVALINILLKKWKINLILYSKKIYNILNLMIKYIVKDEDNFFFFEKY